MDTKQLGEAIAILRGRRTQKQVAERAGLDRTTWSQYESGRRLPRSDNLDKILRGLGCNRQDLADAMWQIRRKELAKQRIAEQLRRLTDGTTPASDGESDDPEASDEQPLTAEAELRTELQEILLRGAVVLEDLLAVMSRSRL